MSGSALADDYLFEIFGYNNDNMIAKNQVFHYAGIVSDDGSVNKHQIFNSDTSKYNNGIVGFNMVYKLASTVKGLNFKCSFEIQKNISSDEQNKTIDYNEAFENLVNIDEKYNKSFDDSKLKIIYEIKKLNP